MAPKLELAEQRWKVVSDLLGCIERLANARNALTVEERFAIAEAMRDTADEYDRGRVFRPAPEPSFNPPAVPGRARVLPRLVRSNKLDFDGRPLFRIM